MGGTPLAAALPRSGHFIAIFIYYYYYYFFFFFFFELVQSTGGAPGGARRERGPCPTAGQGMRACVVPPKRGAGISGGGLLREGWGADTAPTDNLKKRGGQGGAVKGAPGRGCSGAAATWRPHPAGPPRGEGGPAPGCSPPVPRRGWAACAGSGARPYRAPPKLSSSSGRGSASQHVMSISGGLL